MNPPSPPDLELRATLARALGGQYRLAEEVGRGGMGVVYRATDLTLRRDVAVKVLSPDLVGHQAVVERFLAEARIIARLRHPNIVPVHAAGVVDGLVYYVMDFVPGQTLRRRLSREGRLSPALAARILADIASALEASAEAGVVHRDIKPENILVEGTGPRALLTDFGVARILEGDGPTTGAGVAMGTPAYMSPEQASGEPLDVRSDLYALGVVGYEMLAGRPPFDGPPRVLLSRQILDPPVSLLAHRPDLSPGLAAAIMHVLDKIPEARYQSPAAFRAAVLAEQPVTPAPLTVRRRPRRRRLAPLAAALVALTALGVWSARDTGPPAGINPRQSLLVLPFENLRADPELEWLGEGSVSMLTLALGQWRDLSVVDAHRLHDLLAPGEPRSRSVGLEQARRLARRTGAWSVVLGNFTRQGDSLVLVARTYDVASGQRVGLAQVAALASPDVRPAFDALARRLLDLSGGAEASLSSLSAVTTGSLEAYRAYLDGAASLRRWELPRAEAILRRALALDSTFALAYFRLALTRGWRFGEGDAVAREAIARAAQHAERLPERERLMIAAYRAMVEADHARSETLYRQVLARDSTDADAWYGLGDALFHDPRRDAAVTRTPALRAFRRAIALDPGYLLAYEHANAILADAAQADPTLALVTADSLARARRPDGTRLLPEPVRRAAVSRARAEALGTAQAWVEAQPRSIRAQLALFGVHLAADNHAGALLGVTRLRELLPDSSRGFAEFLEARVRFNAGDPSAAGRLVREGLARLRPNPDATDLIGTPVLQDVAASANILAFLGDIRGASRVLALADSVRRVMFPPDAMPVASPSGRIEAWEWARQAQLFSAAGAGRDALETIWRRAADAARAAPPGQGQALARSVAAAPIGLFLQDPSSPALLRELEALSGVPSDPALQALEALHRGDTGAARRLMSEASGAPQEVKRAGEEVALWGFANGDSRPLTAEVFFHLGAYREAIEVLKPFEADQLAERQFDPRWAILGRVRLLRGLSLERLGRGEEAAREFAGTLAQWQEADDSLLPYIQEARDGLRRVTGRSRGS